jgi:hypothetical protein
VVYNKQESKIFTNLELRGHDKGQNSKYDYEMIKKKCPNLKRTGSRVTEKE